MKRLLLLGLSFGMATLGFSQVPAAEPLSYGEMIGNTYYDLHSNSSTGNRLIRNADGSMSATWIEHWDILTADNQPKPNVRGFGYNHYSGGVWQYGDVGECWEANYGCASQYVGWPEMINLESANSDGKQEFMINHTPLKMTTRDAIGTGTWGLTAELDIDKAEDPDGGTWPRAVSSGDYVHMIAVLAGPDQDYEDADGVLIPLRYYRSNDGGASWDIEGANAFSQVGELTVPVDSLVPNGNVCGIDTVNNTTVDSTWNDTITSGMATVFGYTFNADMLGVDSTVYADSDTLMNGDVKDTTAVVMTDSAMGDTFAVVAYTAYNMTTTYDTTWCMDTIVVLDTVTGLHNDAIGGDAYAIAVNGSNVAVTLGGSGLDSDWMVYISNDNGDTWTRRMVKNNHYNGNPEFVVETVDGPANSYLINMDNFEVIIDNSGKVHVFCGSDIITDQGDGGFFTGADLYKEVGAGMFYWNSDMADNTARIMATPDYASDGDTSTYDAYTTEYYGFWTLGWPGASFDANGNIYMMYSAIQEDNDSYFLDPDLDPAVADTLGYMENYMVYSFDGGTTWCGYDEPIGGQSEISPINVAEDIYGIAGGTPIEDDVFPVTVPEITDGVLHFTWQGDFLEPSLALQNDNHRNDVPQAIMYGALDVSGLTSCASNVPDPIIPTTGINEKLNSFEFALVPNPAKDMVVVSSEENISNITLVNMFGQTVKDITVNAANTQNVIVSDLAEGVYVVKVTTAKGIATEKLTITK